VEFEFVGRRPGPPLEGYVESVWFARGRITYRSERIAPTGSTVAAIVLGPPIVEIPRDGAGEPFVATHGRLAGPHDGPVVNAPTAETLAAGIIATPVGCRALFGVDPAPLRGRVVDLAPAWPAAVSLRKALLDEPGSCLDHLEAAHPATLPPRHVRFETSTTIDRPIGETRGSSARSGWSWRGRVLRRSRTGPCVDHVSSTDQTPVDSPSRRAQPCRAWSGPERATPTARPSRSRRMWTRRPSGCGPSCPMWS
jgi:hypothetical protein